MKQCCYYYYYYYYYYTHISVTSLCIEMESSSTASLCNVVFKYKLLLAAIMNVMVLERALVWCLSWNDDISLGSSHIYWLLSSCLCKDKYLIELFILFLIAQKAFVILFVYYDISIVLYITTVVVLWIFLEVYCLKGVHFVLFYYHVAKSYFLLFFIED